MHIVMPGGWRGPWRCPRCGKRVRGTWLRRIKHYLSPEAHL